MNKFAKRSVLHLINLTQRGCRETVFLVVRRDTAAGGIRVDSSSEQRPNNICRRCGCVIPWEEIIPEDYNQLEPPESEGGPVRVYTFLQVMEIDEIDEAKMDFWIHFYMDDIWKDERLKLVKYQDSKKMNILPEDVSTRIWKPDIIFENAKSGEIFKLTVPNTFIKVLQDGSIYRTTRYSLRLSCTMNLRNYPMDSQNCYVGIGSLRNPTSSMQLHWVQDSGSPYENFSVNIDLFDSVAPLKYDVKECRSEQRSDEWISGKFTFLIANCTFERSVRSHLMNTYVPATMVVVMSWISFWLDVSVAPGRVTLGVTSLLTLATQSVRARSMLPPVTYLTAMDVWLLFCIIMVFASLVEYAVAYHMAQMRLKESETKVTIVSLKGPRNRSSVMQQELNRDDDDDDQHCEDASHVTYHQVAWIEKLKVHFWSEWKITEYFFRNRSLDKMSRVLFPLTFVGFCAVYWPSYLCEEET